MFSNRIKCKSHQSLLLNNGAVMNPYLFLSPTKSSWCHCYGVSWFRVCSCVIRVFLLRAKILIYDSVSRFTHSLFTSLPTSPACICTAASGISGPWCYRCSQMLLIRPSSQIEDRAPDSGCKPFQLFWQLVVARDCGLMRTHNPVHVIFTTSLSFQ